MSKEKKSTKEKTIAIMAGMLAFGLSSYGVQQLFKKDLESELKQMAVKFNKKTPMQIDEYTRLDSVGTTGKTNVIYYYTLLEAEKSEVNMDTVNKYIRPGIIENVKNSDDLKTFRDHNIIMDYKYYDKNGLFAMEFSVTPELYNTTSP